MCLYCHRIGCEHPWLPSMTGTETRDDAIINERRDAQDESAFMLLIQSMDERARRHRASMVALDYYSEHGN